MFTGIVEELGSVASLQSGRLTVRCSTVREDLAEGASIAVNGVCLTAVDLRPDSFSADLAPETLRRSNLGDLRPGSRVNLERPLFPSGRLSGHIVQGHVDGTGKLIGLEPIAKADDFWLHIEIPEDLERYVVFKGSIAIEGISLTVANLENLRLTIAIIPHTIKMTNLQSLKPGDPVNIETDIVAKYLEKWTRRDEQTGALTIDRLVAQGF